MENEFSFKELYDVVIKTTYPIEINGKKIESGEVIAAFDKIQLSNFKEIRPAVTAHGGYQDRDLIIWQSTKELRLSFSKGIFNKIQFGLMLNSKLIKNEGQDMVTLHQRQELTSDEEGSIYLKHEPLEGSKIFIYDLDGNKISLPNEIYYEESEYGWKLIGTGLEILTNYVVDYNFQKEQGDYYKIGNQLISGFLEFEGRTKVQDDISGNFRTGVLKIPRLKLMSDLSINLGKSVYPVVGTLEAIGMPVGVRGQEEVMKLIFLDDDLDSDL